MERILLVGGPCSGQVHDLDVRTDELTAVDDTGHAHVYIRTELVDPDGDDGTPITMFRLAGPPGRPE